MADEPKIQVVDMLAPPDGEVKPPLKSDQLAAIAKQVMDQVSEQMNPLDAAVVFASLLTETTMMMAGPQPMQGVPMMFLILEDTIRRSLANRGITGVQIGVASEGEECDHEECKAERARLAEERKKNVS